MLSSLDENRLLMASVLSFEEQLKSFLSVLFCVLVVILTGQLLTHMALNPVVFEVLTWHSHFIKFATCSFVSFSHCGGT